MKGPGTRNPARNEKYQEDIEALLQAFLQMKSTDECRRFLLDLCTPAEITAFAERWKVARLLSENKLSYREIHSETGVSVTTIGRVARFLVQEPHQGYSLALKRLGLFGD